MQDPKNSEPIDPAFRVSTSEEQQIREVVPGTLPQPPVGELPAGQGKWPVPHHETQVGLINLSSRSYRWTHDEALLHSRKNARAVLRDLTVRNALTVRWAPIVQLGWHLKPRDETDPAQIEGTAKLTDVIHHTPYFQDFLQHCLWGEYFGFAGVVIAYEWEKIGDVMCMVVKEFRPIHGDSLVPRWDGEWGILVNGSADVEKDIGNGLGMAHYFTPAERECVVIHTAPAEDVDYLEPQMAAQIRGSGIRGHIYWWWYLKSNYQALLADFSERFSQGVWLAYFDTANEQGREYMADAVAGYKNNRVILLPRTEQGDTAFGLDIKEVGTANPAFLESQIEKMEELIHKYITFQDVNSLDVAVGGDGAGLVTDRISRGIKYCAKRLAQTLTDQFVSVLARYNTPGIPPPVFEFDIDSPVAGEVLGYAETLHQLGGPIDLDHLYELCGLPMPAQDSTVASRIQPLSPQMGQTPQGVPISNPDQQQQAPPPQQEAPPPQQPPQTILD